MIVDFHTHILPGVDDGSTSVAETLAMLEMEAKQGVTRVVATPHFYSRYQSPTVFLEERKRAEELLRSEMCKHSGLPEISVGAEVYFFRGMSESDCLPLLTIDNTDCLLLEMPESVWTDSMYQEIEKIHRQWGITPIIAHIDRYIRPFRDHGIPKRLESMPVLVQANASFFLNRRTASMAMGMLKRDQIHLLGSDCHDLCDRAPNLGGAVDAIRRRLGAATLERVMQHQDVVFAAREE